jgi:trans-2,3-dihydro-3-hydroxyanthranilate isomerase
MGRLRYRLVDVFTETRFAGNPLCVVMDECPPELMPRIAREVNLSETTFPTVTADSAYEMRIFTPTIELPFAGHPSVGTAWCLGPGRWRQSTIGGTVTVVATESGARMTQPTPELTTLPTQEREIIAALGLPAADHVVRSTAGGVTHILVCTDHPLDVLEPDLGAVAEVSRGCDAHTIVPMRRRDDTTIHARVFAPAAGVPEDPGSGSAAGPIALVGHDVWTTNAEVTVLMGAEIGRPSRIEVAVADELWVGGPVVISAEGHFYT